MSPDDARSSEFNEWSSGLCAHSGYRLHHDPVHVMTIGTSRQISLCVYPICPDHTHRWPDASPTVRVLYNNDSDVQPSLGRYAHPGGHTVLIHAPLRRHHRDQPPVVCLGVGGMRCLLGQLARHAADQLSLPAFDRAARSPKPKHSLVIARRDFFINVRDTTISPYHDLTRGTHTATLYCLSQYPGSLTAPFSLSSTQHSASPRS